MMELDKVLVSKYHDQTVLGIVKKVNMWHGLGLTTKTDVIVEMKEAIRDAARCRGLEISRFDYHRTENQPGMNLLDLNTFIGVKALCWPAEPTPGYDADGRECWEYPK